MAGVDPHHDDEQYLDPDTDERPAVHRLAIHAIRLLRAANDFGDPDVIAAVRMSTFIVGQAVARDTTTTSEDGLPS